MNIQRYGWGVFVWGVWATMLGIALAYIAVYGRNIPLAEDWLLVAPLTGNEPDLAAWAWAQNNEHRVPLPRLVLLLLLGLTGGDFRAGMVFNALALGALAAAMILVIRRVRGRTRFTDAFFPVALLHIGNWENLVWSWQLQFVLSTVLTCVLLLIVAIRPGTPTPRAAVLAGLSLVLLPLCGANGLIFALAMAPWFAHAGWLRWRSTEPERRWPGPFLIASVAVSLLLTGLYFVDYERATWNPPSPGIAATLKTSAKFLALGFGPAASMQWELSTLAAVGLLLLTGAVLVAGAVRARGAERQRAMGLLLFGVGVAVLALAIGWGRAGLVPTVGMPTRYVLLAVPALCAAPFIWEIYGRPVHGRVVQMALLFGMGALIPMNTRAGFQWRDWYRHGMDAVERDLAAGVPRSVLAERHAPFLLHWDPAKLEAGMRMLHEAGLGPFRKLRDSPPVGEATRRP